MDFYEFVLPSLINSVYIYNVASFFLWSLLLFLLSTKRPTYLFKPVMTEQVFQ